MSTKTQQINKIKENLLNLVDITVMWLLQISKNSQQILKIKVRIIAGCEMNGFQGPTLTQYLSSCEAMGQHLLLKEKVNRFYKSNRRKCWYTIKDLFSCSFFYLILQFLADPSYVNITWYNIVWDKDLQRKTCVEQKLQHLNWITLYIEREERVTSR